MVEVIPTGPAEAASAADEAAEGERAGDEQPEDAGVEERVDGEAGPEGADGERSLVCPDAKHVRRLAGGAE